MTYCVGLTGNTASGKSTVAAFFHALGVPIISADDISKELTRFKTPAYEKILLHFGQGILLENGQLNRSALRNIIFSNPKERQWLENLLHPLIRKRIQEDLALYKTTYCMIEIPLLFDTRLYPYISRVLLVNAPLDSQIKRLMQRDTCTEKQALAILSTQPDFKKRQEIADDILCNDSSLEILQTKIQNLHHKYLQEFRKYDKMSSTKTEK